MNDATLPPLYRSTVLVACVVVIAAALHAAAATVNPSTMTTAADVRGDARSRTVDQTENRTGMTVLRLNTA